MRVDLGGALGTDPGVTESDLDALDGEVATAHERIDRGRRDREFGYAALAPDLDTAAVRSALADFDHAAVLTVGIGGSTLPAAATVGALAHGESTDPEGRDPGRDPSVHFLDNVDPAHARRLLDSLPLPETMVHVVSHSGQTVETLANFLVVREAIDAAGGDWTEQTLVTTGPDGPLRAMAESQGLPTLDAPESVPGRFSPLTTMGVVPAAMRGHDLDALLDGATAATATLGESLFACPAYAYGGVAYALAERGAATNVLFPYAEALAPLAEWVAQLWAESLGKDGWGQTPVRALGATDQHSQLQLYRAGPPDKVCTFIRPAERPACGVPDPDDEALSHLRGTDLGAIIDAEADATAASLHRAGRPTVEVTAALDERGVGALLVELMAATVLVGELAGVETFTQPAVEWGKRAARGVLGDPDCTAEAEAVADRPSFVVE
jgi:glucose-6-phosphate isomerase